MYKPSAVSRNRQGQDLQERFLDFDSQPLETDGLHAFREDEGPAQNEHLYHDSDQRGALSLWVEEWGYGGIRQLASSDYGYGLSIFLNEDTEHPEVVRVSLRSVDDFPCNEMAAQFFNGGGHKNASGGRLQCTMEEAVRVAQKAIQAYSALLK